MTMEDKVNYTVFTTFLTDGWKLDKLTNEQCGKIWKALVKYFTTGEDTPFDDVTAQFVYEDMKQTNIRNATRNHKKYQNRKIRESQLKP